MKELGGGLYPTKKYLAFILLLFHLCRYIGYTVFAILSLCDFHTTVDVASYEVKAAEILR